MIQIFDSLAHPTLTGKWFNHDIESSFEILSNSLSVNKYAGACAIGLAGVERYSHKEFMEACSNDARLIPIAGFNPEKSSCIGDELQQLQQMGYKGLKIHPRSSCLDLTSDSIASTLQSAEEFGMIVFLCTYYHCKINQFPEYDYFNTIVKLLKKTPECKVVLAHGGGVELMRYAELVRFNPNLLLDLSFTICKYEGSSIDSDIQFLFRQLDEKICIGTDFPEFSHEKLRLRFEEFAEDLSDEKRNNIAFKNIQNFLEVT